MTKVTVKARIGSFCSRLSTIHKRRMCL